MEQNHPKTTVVNSTDKVDPPSAANLGMKTSLYVGDLDDKVSSTDLFYVFSQIGKVSSVHLCVDVLTGDSLRYGYVNFLSPLDASCALSSLNHTTLKGKPMRVMWCQRNPYPRRAGVTNLFVKNLDPSVTSAQLQYMFQAFGTILSCKVVEENGKSKCFGFVHFEDEGSVDLAVSAMNDKMIGGKKLFVSRFMNKSQRIAANDEKFTNLYVKNLDENLTDDELKEKFSEFGTVTNAIIMRDGEGKSKGFGFINYESTEEAKQAVEALNGAQFGSKELFVGRAQKKAERKEILKSRREQNKIFEERYKASNVYVRNLHPYVDDKILAEHFRPCGKIESVKVIRDDNGISKGFGFVRFSSPSEARVALLSSQGSTLYGKPLFLGIAMQKQERQKTLQNFSYFMPFTTGSMRPPLPSPNRQNAVEHAFRGFFACDSLANTHNAMDFISNPANTAFPEFPYNIRIENMQANRSCGGTKSTNKKCGGIYSLL